MLLALTLSLIAANDWALEVRDDRELDNGGGVIVASQWIGATRVLGASISIEYDSAGRLSSVNSGWVPVADSSCPSSPTEAVKSAAMKEWALLPEHLESVALPREGGEFVCAFGYEDDDLIGVLDLDGRVLHEILKSQRHYDGTAAGTARIKQYPTSGSDVRIPSGIRNVGITSSREPIWFSSNCRYHLGRYNGSHPLGRPGDDNSDEYEREGPCSGFTPQFTSTSTSWLPQATFYYFLEKTRLFAGVPMWSAEAPAASAKVTLNVDVGFPWCGPAPACYSAANQTISIKPDTNGLTSWDTVAHEYGHYISWTYGGGGWWCTDGVDEGVAVEEAVADVMAFIVAKNERGLGYFAPFVVINPSQSGTPHRSDVSSIEFYGPRCAESNYRKGDFFRQAMWEVLHDANCTTGNCTPSIVWSGQVYSSGNPIQRTQAALAYALKRLGPDITFSQLVSKMSESLGYAEREPFKNVFRHHGLQVQ